MYFFLFPKTSHQSKVLFFRVDRADIFHRKQKSNTAVYPLHCLLLHTITISDYYALNGASTHVFLGVLVI